MKKAIILFYTCVWFCVHSKSQTITFEGDLINLNAPKTLIGTTNQYTFDAALEIFSTNKGLLIPRLSLNATNLAFPLIGFIPGMVIYNQATTTPGPYSVIPGIYYCDGFSWIRCSTSSWSMNGNSSTNGSHFIGTTDTASLRFKVNNQKAGYIGYNSRNIFLGIGAGNSIASGNYNVAIGDNALFSNTFGDYNTAIGYRSLFSNESGSENTAVGKESLSNNTSGYHNSALGVGALQNNTTGASNTATGHESLYSNISGNQNTATGQGSLYFNNGSDNTANGFHALHNNTASNNTAIGSNAMGNNTSGSNNVASGSRALFLNTQGANNTAAGHESLYSNVSGNQNTATGQQSLYFNIIGSDNTATGFHALHHNTASGNTAIGSNALANNLAGTGNTAVGLSSMLNNTAGSNNVAVGYNAQVPSSTGSNQVRIGNGSITVAEIQVAWTITSDSRYKSAIQNSNLGLKFINQLRPVSYFRNNDKSEKLEFGFIAQEVEQVLQQSGSLHTGIISKDDAGMYSMRYNDLMAPMVKAIQEQQAMIDELRKEIEQLKKQRNKK